jgi:two-component system, OmpR family, sensor histidine kinase CpxA
MKPVARSLFLRIFLWFWMTMIATAIALVLTFVFQRTSVPDRWRGMLGSTARYSGTMAIAELERRGTAAAGDYLDELERQGHLQACIFDGGGIALAGKHCSSFADMARRAVTTREPVIHMRFGIARAAIELTGSDGRSYIYATDLPASPRPPFETDHFSFGLEWGVALLVSGCICYLLTRHITAPIVRLREASQRLASGELGARAAVKLERRGDELGALVSDFNRMAERIEELVSGQRQLICDMSHELRSPLARLNVALDLARKNEATEAAFEHMERDLECLNEMIGRLLTIARIDVTSAPIEFSPVNASELVGAIVADAGFEAKRRNVRIELSCEQDYWVDANPELLNSAIENIVRNAIRFTDEWTRVEVEIKSGEIQGKAWVHISVRDFGPGLPEQELEKIFRPFYRASESRDRRSGGAGLGLAIAERVVRMHHGSIRAENATPQGLNVRIELPVVAAGS